VDPRIVDTFPIAERVEEPVKYDPITRYPGEVVAEPAIQTRVPHESRVRTTPLPPQNWFRRYEALLIGTLAVAAFFAAWQGVASARIWSRLFLPGPVDVWDAFIELVKDGELPADIAVSGQEFVIGYGLAALVGIPFGLLLGWYPRLRYVFDPFITFFYATPRIVLIPLFIIWLGIGIESKIAVIYLGAVFAILINTMAGVRSLDASLLRVARSFGAGDRHIFRTIALPGSVPFILTGLRLGTGHALIGVVVAEYVAAQHGLGRMMMIAGSTFQSSKVFVGLFLIAAAGLALTYGLQRIERHFDAWRPQR
jgi:ABC-type nitrate/sulfonate/bicarbonate transport system permease component